MRNVKSLKYWGHQLWFTTRGLKAYTGLTTGQINALRSRKDIPEHQMNGEHSLVLFDPDDVVALQFQIWKHGRNGSAKLRKKPFIKNQYEYTSIAEKLERVGVTQNDFEIVSCPNKPGYLLQDPADRKVLDMLPFSFVLGDSTQIPAGPEAQDSFQAVQGCYGFADETNQECTKSCAFFESCCAARLGVLESIAKALDAGKDPKNMMRRAQVQATRKLGASLSESP